MRQTPSLIGIFLFVIILAACNAGDDDITADPPFADPNELASDKILAMPVTVEINPYETAPLTALATIQTLEETQLNLVITGSEPVVHTFKEYSATHTVPILGLYPGSDNQVILTLLREDGKFARDTLIVSTSPLPPYFPKQQIIHRQDEQMEPGLTLCGFSYSREGWMLSRPFLFDKQGEIRWFLEVKEHISGWFGPVKRMRNGNWIFGTPSVIYEYDMLGREVNSWTIPGYSQHHEILEKPDGNLIIGVSDEELPTTLDQIIEIDRTSGAVVRQWDLREVLDINRYNFVWNNTDWLHLNSIWYDATDGGLLISGRHQGVFKISADNELRWIIAPHRGWGQAGIEGDGPLTADFLLTAVNAEGTPLPLDIQRGNERTTDFDWPWGQHAAMMLPNGNILTFDNGFQRYFTYNSQDNHSRGVEYAVDLENRTVKQLWEYGRESGNAFYSRNLSDADYLPLSGNRLLCSGNIHYEGERRARILEISQSGTLIFEANVNFTNYFSGNVDAWGETDVLYRAERISLYPD